jgi:hypothetical protein
MGFDCTPPSGACIEADRPTPNVPKRPPPPDRASKDSQTPVPVFETKLLLPEEIKKVHPRVLQLAAEIAGGVVEQAADPLHISLLSNLKRDINATVVRSAGRVLTQTLSNVLTTQLVPKVGETIIPGLARATSQEVATALTPAVTHAVTPAVVSSMAHSPKSDFYCAMCKTTRAYCSLCRKGTRADARRLRYADYYSRYYSNYYGPVYGDIIAPQTVDDVVEHFRLLPIEQEWHASEIKHDAQSHDTGLNPMQVRGKIEEMLGHTTVNKDRLLYFESPIEVERKHKALKRSLFEPLHERVAVPWEWHKTLDAMGGTNENTYQPNDTKFQK